MTQDAPFPYPLASFSPSFRTYLPLPFKKRRYSFHPSRDRTEDTQKAQQEYSSPLLAPFPNGVLQRGFRGATLFENFPLLSSSWSATVHQPFFSFWIFFFFPFAIISALSVPRGVEGRGLRYSAKAARKAAWIH